MRLALPAILLTNLLVSGLSSFLAGDVFALELHEPRPSPPIELRDMDGEAANFDQLRGKVVVVNFWATWCAPCKREMPSLGRLAELLEGEDIEVVTVAADRASPDRLRAFMHDTGTTHLPIYRDPKMTLMRSLKLQGLPATIVLDAYGRLIGEHVGFETWDRPEIVERLRDAASARLPQTDRA